MNDVIHDLSNLRSRFSIFDKNEEHFYSSLSTTIKAVKEQRPKGKWIYDDYWKAYKCSICGRHVETEVFENPVSRYPYCHCGADMRN